MENLFIEQKNKLVACSLQLWGLCLIDTLKSITPRQLQIRAAAKG